MIDLNFCDCMKMIRIYFDIMQIGEFKMNHFCKKPVSLRATIVRVIVNFQLMYSDIPFYCFKYCSIAFYGGFITKLVYNKSSLARSVEKITTIIRPHAE